MTEDNNVNEGMGRAWWASALVVLVVVVGLVAVLVTRDDRRAENTAASTTSPSSVPTTSTTASVPSGSTSASTSSTAAVPTAAAWPDAGCNGTPGSGAPAQAGLLAVSWDPVGAVSLPTSKVLGPTRVEGPVRRCFQHSPAGAVMAAANTFGALTLTSYREIFMARMTPGAGRDETLANVQPSDFDGGMGQFAGYKLNGCTPTACNLSLAVQSAGLWGQEDFTLIWSDGDWKLNGAYPLGALGSLPNGLPQGWVAWAP